MHLHTHNLVKKYKNRRVVDQVSVEVTQGEIVGLLGPNGAGKTTTFYMIVGLINPYEGTILLDERDITKEPVYKRARMGIGYLAQEPELDPDRDVRGNVMLAVAEIGLAMTPMPLLSALAFGLFAGMPAAISDAAIVSGLIAVLLRIYSGKKPQDILDTPPDFVAALQLEHVAGEVDDPERQAKDEEQHQSDHQLLADQGEPVPGHGAGDRPRPAPRLRPLRDPARRRR